MDHNELVGHIRALGMRVDVRRNTVSGPAGVRNASVDVQFAAEVEGVLLGLNLVPQAFHFAGLLHQCKSRVHCINPDSWGVEKGGRKCV